MSKREVKCKSCYKPLEGDNVRIGLCDTCAANQIPKLKKRIKTSFFVSFVLLALVFLVRQYVRSAAYVSDTEGYVGDIFIPIFSGNLAMNARMFQSLFYPSRTAWLIFLAICFFAPFSSFVQVDYNTYRRKAETNLFTSGVFNDVATGMSSTRSDDAGLFIVSVIVSALSGPFFFVYRFYKLKTLSDHLKQHAAA